MNMIVVYVACYSFMLPKKPPYFCYQKKVPTNYPLFLTKQKATGSINVQKQMKENNSLENKSPSWVMCRPKLCTNPGGE